MKIQVLIPAAGTGRRLGADLPKALVPLREEPIFVHTIRRFHDAGLSNNIIVLAPAAFLKDFQKHCNHYFPHEAIKIIEGGKQRQDSVRYGLEHLDKDTDLVVIHDAARPFVPVQCIRESVEVAWVSGGATVAIPAVDTILESNSDMFLVDTPDRNKMWYCQTPQTFRVNLIRQAHHIAYREKIAVTDDATLLQRLGHTVKLVMGARINFKITTQHDLFLASCLLERKAI